MSDEPKTFRAHLLDTEPPDPSRRQQLEQEIKRMLDDRLTRKGRIAWTLGMIAAALSTVFGAVMAIAAHIDAPLHAVWWIYTVANAFFAVFSAGILRSGRFDRRRYQWFVALAPLAALAITILLFWRAVSAPSLGSVLWVVFGLLCVLIDMIWLIQFQFHKGQLAWREATLRLELRLTELQENMESRG